jgi:hypothetical protein
MHSTRTLRVVTLTVAGALAAGSFIGCSSSSSSSGPGAGDAGRDAAATTDTGASDDAGTPADTGSAADTGTPQMLDDAGCIALVNEAPLVQQMNVAGDPPTPMGGTVVDGTYFITAASVYGSDAGVGPTGNNFQNMSVVSGGGTLYALVAGVGNGASMSNGTIATSGANITLTQTCPSNDVLAFNRFDATGTTLTVYTSTPPVSALTFTKQ